MKNSCHERLRDNIFNSSVTSLLFRMGEGGQRLPTSFFSVTSLNVGIITQNFLTFSFNPFASLVENFKAIPSASPKLLNLNQGHPLKNWFFWSNPYTIEVMMSSLIEILELPNFGHMIKSTI